MQTLDPIKQADKLALLKRRPELHSIEDQSAHRPRLGCDHINELTRASFGKHRHSPSKKDLKTFMNILGQQKISPGCGEISQALQFGYYSIVTVTGARVNLPVIMRKKRRVRFVNLCQTLFMTPSSYPRLCVVSRG